jgi:tetratricopeptide (TPR) repeat protein
MVTRHPSIRRPAPRWGEPPPGPIARLIDRVRVALAPVRPRPRRSLVALPVALRRGELAERYLAAAADDDHRGAGASAARAMEASIAAEDWWPADIWAHRAMWHFEQGGQALHAARTARRIGDLRTAAGDATSARRYYAEAISEARDIGAEREEGLAALGLGRAELDLGDVTTARRLAGIAEDLLERSGAPSTERDAARELRGSEKPVGPPHA